MRKDDSVIRKLMDVIISHPRPIIIVLIILTLFFAYMMKDLRIDANIFALSEDAEPPVFVLTPENKPEEKLVLKRIGTVDYDPDRGETVSYERQENSFDEGEFINPIPYELKEVQEYVYPEGKEEEAFHDGYVIVFTSKDMFTPEVLNAIYDVRKGLEGRWEIG